MMVLVDDEQKTIKLPDIQVKNVSVKMYHTAWCSGCGNKFVDGDSIAVTAPDVFDSSHSSSEWEYTLMHEKCFEGRQVLRNE